MAKSKSGKKQSLSSIKSSMFSRGLSMARLTVQAGAQLASQGVMNALASDETKDASWKEFLKGQARNLTRELGELKGSLMKAGQMLSMYGEHFLPPEANEFLKSLQSDSPPLDWKPIHASLKKYLTPEQLSQLEIEHEALASASMGQVHRAIIKATGEEIVLKIQYPNVDKAIDSDLKAIRSLLGIMKILPKGLNLDHLFSEVREMLVQETDYETEAKLTQKFYKFLKEDDRYVVPKVYPEFSNRKILATSFEKGLRVDDPAVQALSQERRNTLAGNFLEIYFKELFEWKMMQTDPHSGNYKIRIEPGGQDKLVLLDFGASRSFAPSFLKAYHRMIKGALMNDPELFRLAAEDLKFIEHGDNPELVRIFSDFCFESVEPFIAPEDPRNIKDRVAADGSYDWKNSDLPRRLTKKALQVLQKFSWRAPPREIIFLDRKTGGVFIFMGLLRARYRGRDLLLKYLGDVK